MTDKKTLFAGPFLGELGWELFAWQGFIRSLAKEYDRVIVSSRRTSRFLYEDFYDEFEEYDPQSYVCSFFECMTHQYHNQFHKKYPNADHVFFHKMKMAHKFFGDRKQEFIKYESDTDVDTVDFVLHARKIKGGGQYKVDRNWEKNKWNRLSENLTSKGFKLASIGTKDSSIVVDNSLDYLDKDLKEICALLGKSKMIVGASSGPMHFASLCGCPQLVWSSGRKGRGGDNRSRYEDKWNVFDTPVYMYEGGGWNPEVGKIESRIDIFLERLENESRI